MWSAKFPKRYLIVILTFLCTCVCYIERVGFSIAYTVAADAAGVNQSTKGTILSTFYYGYACSQIPGGWAAQKIGGRRVLLLSFILWSLTSALVPLDPNRVMVLVIARLLVGVAQGFIFPSIHTVLAQWVPPHERSRSVSLTTSGMYLGAAAGMLLLPSLVKLRGPQSVFPSEAALGAMWSLLWFKYSSDPLRSEHPKATAAGFGESLLPIKGSQKVKVEKHSAKTSEGLTNNSYLAESHEVRRCVLKHQTLGEYVLEVAKKRLDNMLYVGLTEDHRESATMFANVVGAQVISQSIASSHGKNLAANDKSEESSSSPGSKTYTSYFQNSSTDKNASKMSATQNIEATSNNMTVGKLMEAYETCISSLRRTQGQRRTTSLKKISPANFSKEARLKVPKVVLQQIKSLNSLDMELYKYAQSIFSEQHKKMMQELGGALQETEDIKLNNPYSASSWNFLWLAMPIVLLLLSMALFVNARRRTSKLKI